MAEHTMPNTEDILNWLKQPNSPENCRLRNIRRHFLGEQASLEQVEGLDFALHYMVGRGDLVRASSCTSDYYGLLFQPKDERPRSKPAPKDNMTRHCNFCGKSQHEVRMLIAGPNVYICDECMELSVGILSRGNKKLAANFMHTLCHELIDSAETAKEQELFLHDLIAKRVKVFAS